MQLPVLEDKIWIFDLKDIYVGMTEHTNIGFLIN